MTDVIRNDVIELFSRSPVHFTATSLVSSYAVTHYEIGSNDRKYPINLIADSNPLDLKLLRFNATRFDHCAYRQFAAAHMPPSAADKGRRDAYLRNVAMIANAGGNVSIGSLEPGKMADILILNSNPLDDIRSTADISYVVKNGAIYDAGSMTQMYPTYRPLPKPFGQSEQDWEQYKARVPPPMFH